MTHNRPHPHHDGSGQPNPYPPPFPRIPHSLHGPAQSPAHCASPAAPQPPATPPAPAWHQPQFQVRVTKHTGLVVALYNQSYTVTGTFAQCEAAIRSAQQHNLLAGWWSFASILIWNWVALTENHSARKVLRRQAAQAGLAPQPGPWAPLAAPPTQSTNSAYH